MGVKSGHNGHNMGFGNLTNLKPVINTTTEEDTNKIPKTRIIRISEQLYGRFAGHSKRYYNVADYETILSDLLDSYEKHEPNNSYFHLTRY